ncbi:prenyltransferase [Vagococcus fluvialis]|uniref:prenyltransferase n=1 Tax=Vagococcus fluvialis TaxID=2738 RepID=UPI001A8E82C9|nr:prenyltransferase [Vagococcus fluvialis]MBO0479046.1 prenyltransferase [Vagococcus fluvialis]MBO0483439.1 prenyltransferase [Vagococcus fluvialis]
MELRTGFATGLPIFSTSLFASFLTGRINALYLVLFFICGFSFNIVANVANEIRAFMKNEESEETFTGHLGSEGLVRGDATFLDACLVLLAWIALGGLTGLALVYLTKSLGLFLLGLLGLLAAITYSLGPAPYIVLPIGELVSGLLVGGLSSLVAFWLQTGTLTKEAYLYAFICMMLTVFLMSTNNTGDYDKDQGVRKTLPHIIGFRNSILLMIPEGILVLIAWSYLSFSVLLCWQSLIGFIIFFIQGYLRWLKDYLKIQEVYPEMGRDFGPRPLLLIRSFHFIMGLSFLITIL